MPRQKLNREQARLWRSIRNGIRTVDDLSDQMYREILAIIQGYGTATLTVADQRVLMQAIERVLDRTYGLSRASAPNSRMYRAIVRELDNTSLDVYRESYKQLERVVTRSKGAQTWKQVDTAVKFAKPTKNVTLTTVRNALDDDPVAKTRLLRSRKLDVNRAWVPKEKWNTKTGWRLSDRLWHQGRNSRNQIDELIREAIRKGTDPIKLAKDLETHLNASARARAIYRADGTVLRRINTTLAPRGGLGSFPARRLAITEISRINGAATIESGALVPGGQGIRWLVSNSHNHRDICDRKASADSYGLGGGVYPFDAVPDFPSHPLCRCCLSVMSLPSPEVVDSIVKKYLPND